jgi:raffinose/stachyose/melibiose transport system substrate-binding protein
MSYKGKIYAVPGVSWFGGYFYNKGMFDEHGWTIPKTFDEFLGLCGKIQDAGIKPIANPIKNPNFLMHYALSYVQPAFTRSAAGMDFDLDYAAGNVKMADHFGPYLEKWSEVVKRGFVTAEDLGMDYDQAIDEFCAEKAAIFDSGPWDVDVIYGKNPNMRIDMMPFVGDDPNEPGWLFGGPGIRFGINAKLGEPGNEAKLQACVDVLALISTPEGQMAYWENNKGGSSYLKGVKLDMPSEYDGCKEVFAAGHVYNSFQVWNVGVFDEFGKQLQGFVSGDVTLQQVMEATDAKNLELLEKLRESE